MKYPLVFLLFSTLLVLTHTQVLGIDFGTQFWKAALISPGKNLVIVENSRSQRKTLNSIAFHEGLRFFEDQSKNKRLKKPHLSYFYLNRLIKSLDDPSPLEGYQFEENTYIIEEGDQDMTLQQVVAMILKNIKNLASQQAGTDIKDVVLSVPAHWGFKAKMSLVNSAYLADLSVLGLINENSAAAINFAISRNDTDPINIVFFNLGSHNLQISVMKLFGFYDEQKNKTIQSLETLSHVSAENVGGLKIDEEIAHYLADQFHQKHKINPKENKKSYTKLLVKSSEIKETLSANKDTHVYVEGLIDGIDLNFGIKRAIIDETNTFQDFQKYLTEALQKAKLSKDDIHSVELIGGSSRIPKVNSIVKNYFNPIEVGAHINGDEAMAFGCALRAANLSLTFRVKQLHFYDGLDINTRAVISTEEKGQILQQNLFNFADQHGNKKIIKLEENSEDVKVSVYGGEDLLKEYKTNGVGSWKEKYENQNLTGEPNLVIQFSMSSVHIAELKDVYVNVTTNTTEIKDKVDYVEEQEEIQIEIQEEEPKDEAKKEENIQEEQKKQQTEAQNEQKNEEVKEEMKEEVKEEQKQDEEKEVQKEQVKEEGEEEKQEKKKTRKQKVKKTKTVRSKVEEFKIQSKKHVVSFEETFSKYAKFKKQEVDEKRKVIQKYEDYEKYIKDKAKIRNDFQSALYYLKDNFEDQGIKTFSQQSELESLKEIVLKELQWMDENAWTAEKEQFQEHFKTLTNTYEPIYNRTTEYKNRQSTYNETFKYLGAVYQKTEELLKTHPWIEDKVQAHLVKVNETALWIQEKLKQQVEKPLNENPIIYNHQMVFKAEELRDAYYLLRLIPRPKFQHKPKDKEETIPKEENIEKEEAQETNDSQQKAQNEQNVSGDDDNEESQTKSEDL